MLKQGLASDIFSVSFPGCFGVINFLFLNDHCGFLIVHILLYATWVPCDVWHKFNDCIAQIVIVLVNVETFQYCRFFNYSL